METNAIEYMIEVEQCDIPVRGNALACGDDAEDRAAEDEILARLDRGDVWAWASVRVLASWECFTGASSWLGGCSYASESDFKGPEFEVTEPDGSKHLTSYYEDLCSEALDDLKRQLAEAIARGKAAEAFPPRLWLATRAKP